MAREAADQIRIADLLVDYVESPTRFFGPVFGPWYIWVAECNGDVAVAVIGALMRGEYGRWNR